MIYEILNELGLKDKEIKVYLTILEQGKITPADIAHLTGINRSTVYSIAKNLIGRGIVLEDVGDKQNYLIPLSPNELKNIIRKEERELQDKKTLIEQAINELKVVSKNTEYSVPKISFISEENLERYLYKQSPVWSQDIMNTDTIWWGFQDPTFVKHYGEWIDWYWKKSAPSKLSLRLLSNESKYEKEMGERNYERRLVKYWNGDGDFTATTWVVGDYLILIVTDQKPRYLMQIHDAKLAHNMREIFKGIWKSLE